MMAKTGQMTDDGEDRWVTVDSKEGQVTDDSKDRQVTDDSDDDDSMGADNSY